MKKRLRKKRHLGEFIKWGAPIAIVRKHKDDFDSFLDNFIEQAIERNGLYFGGGGKEDYLDGVIELGKTSDNPEERLKKILEWLANRKDVESYVIGEKLDLWHGTFCDTDF
jgi:uncharacterized protein